MQGRLLAVFGTSALLVSLAVPSGLVAADEIPLPLKSDGVEAALDDAKRVVDAATRSKGSERGKGAERPRLAAERSRLAASGVSASVTVGDNFYEPQNLTIDVGTTVTWTYPNSGRSAHTVTARDGSFDSGTNDPLEPGDSFQHTFNQAGTIPYFCQFHDEQTGTIEVVSASGGGTGGGGGGGGSTGQGSSTGSGDNLTGPGSESAAGESAGAAGSDSRLPATGLSVLALFIVGAALLGLGALARRAHRPSL